MHRSVIANGRVVDGSGVRPAARAHPHRPLTCADEAPAVAHSTRAHSREEWGKAPQRPTTQPNTHAHPADPRTRGEGAGADARSHCSARSARIKYPPGNYPVLSRRGRIATLPAAAQKGQRGACATKDTLWEEWDDGPPSLRRRTPGHRPAKHLHSRRPRWHHPAHAHRTGGRGDRRSGLTRWGRKRCGLAASRAPPY